VFGNAGPALSGPASPPLSSDPGLALSVSQASSPPVGERLITELLNLVEMETQVLDQLFRMEMDFLQMYVMGLQRSFFSSDGFTVAAR
jgi:hypothetical protein